MTQSTWQAISAKKRQDLYDSIPQEWRIDPSSIPSPETQPDITTFPSPTNTPFLSQEELQLTSQPAHVLLPLLASGSVSSSTLTTAFCKLASLSHQLTNSLSETCFPRAMAMAQTCDAYLAEQGKTMGPLHGLPISLKDNFHLKNLDATVGFTSHASNPSPVDAELPQLLESLGAVFYCKTNTPTAMQIAESVNNLTGRTVSPSNRLLTSGGSSGGESSLIKFGGSCLGVGTDIGGSLRIPAACTGIFTLKPSFGRFPTLGCRSGMYGQESVQSINGPMAKTLEDLVVFAKAVVDGSSGSDSAVGGGGKNKKAWRMDPRCLPIPWRDGEADFYQQGGKGRTRRKIRVAVMYNDGMALPTPPVVRALKETVEKMRNDPEQRFEVLEEEWSPKDQQQGLDLLSRMFTADGGVAIRKELEKTGEPWREEMLMYRDAKSLSGYEYWLLHMERQGFQKRYLDRWCEAGIDALLCPATPYSGVENGKFKHVGYTGTFNVLDYPAVCFPTGITADKTIDVPAGSDYTPMSDLDRDIQADYNPEAIHGSPVNLQIVAQRLEEEKCLAMCKTLLETLK